MGELSIRHAQQKDLAKILEIYEKARVFMSEHGNPRQWARRGWPPESVVREDIETGINYVVEHEGLVVGVFVYLQGVDIDPTYRQIEGSWLSDVEYGVIHRIASSGEAKGVGRCVVDWAYEKCHHLRIDTHEDNIVMQNMLLSCGFVRCGIIHVLEDTDPRIAFEKL